MDSGIMISGDSMVRQVSADALGRVGRIAAFVIFTSIGAQFATRLPYTPVPITMQTLFVVLSGVVLGPRDGFFAMLSYLAVGLAGLPVFANFSFGPAVLAGPTGGYLLAFPAAALVAGSAFRLLGRGSLSVLAAALSGISLILLSGALYLAVFTGLSLGRAVSLGIVPFLAGACLKSLIAVVILYKRK